MSQGPAAPAEVACVHCWLAPPLHDQRISLVPLAVAALLVLPPSLKYFYWAFVEPLDRTRRISLGWKSGCADGLILPERLCQRLTERAVTLQRMADRGVVIWSTGYPMLTMRMSGSPGAFSALDIFYMTRTDAAFADLIEKIRQMNPSALLFDDPTDQVLHALPPVHAFNRRLIEALGPDYCSAGTVGGWRIMERSDRCAETSTKR